MLDMSKLLKQIEKAPAPKPTSSGKAHERALMRLGIEDWTLVLVAYPKANGTIGTKAAFVSLQNKVTQFFGKIGDHRVVEYLADCDTPKEVVQMVSLFNKAFSVQVAAHNHLKAYKPKTMQEGINAVNAVYSVLAGNAPTTTIAASGGIA